MFRNVFVFWGNYWHYFLWKQDWIQASILIRSQVAFTERECLQRKNTPFTVKTLSCKWNICHWMYVAQLFILIPFGHYQMPTHPCTLGELQTDFGLLPSLQLQRMLRMIDLFEVACISDILFLRAASKTFQNLRVSSAAAEHTIVPSGDCAVWRTREVWPVRSAIFVMFG